MTQQAQQDIIVIPMIDGSRLSLIAYMKLHQHVAMAEEVATRVENADAKLIAEALLNPVMSTPRYLEIAAALLQSVSR